MTEVRTGIAADQLVGAHWRKSSRSGAIGNCVELAPLPGQVAIRDSKSPGGPALVLPADSLTAMLRAVRAGSLRKRTTEDHLRALVARGYEFLHPRDAEGNITAVVGVRAHHDVVDVIRLHAEDDAIATRVPMDTEDVLNPTTVLWTRTGWAVDVLHALSGLPEDHTPGVTARALSSAGRGCWVPTATGRAKWLSASA
ncbi:DUF397 domain-containing protein [Actinokineospora sp. G85]|uniref:DUF397 domain-containing protein n=1 Tax=Actinokineospora sp. G85 TaxID=3406626 RepID=UPI003C72FE22